MKRVNVQHDIGIRILAAGAVCVTPAAHAQTAGQADRYALTVTSKVLTSTALSAVAPQTAPEVNSPVSSSLQTETSAPAPLGVQADPSTEAPPAPAEAASPDIVVTGSRLRSGFNTPTPITVVSTEQLTALAPNSAGEALARLPAFVGSQITSNGGSSSVLLGNAQALVNLRGLGANRTLVLLNGERLPPSNALGSVDTNVIPQALLQRIDVVTGGASSTYGSDAVAGVVNFVLDTKFTGLKIDANAGVTAYGDGGSQNVSVTAGHAFADGRARLLGNASYFYQAEIGLPPQGRDWFDRAAGLVTLPPGSATQFGVIPDVRYSTMATGGLIVRLNPVAGQTVGAAGTAALLNMQFGFGGALVPFDRGTNTGAAFQSGGSGPSPVNQLSPQQDRLGGYARAEYDLNGRLTVFVDALYNRSRTHTIGAYSYQQTTRAFTIYADNPYIPAPVAAVMTANNIASFNVGRYGTELPIITESETSLRRFSGGVRGSLSDRWSFDATIAQSRSVQDLAQRITINRNLYAAADAVVGPGGIVCRSTLTGLDPGCVPINILGINTISAEGRDYISEFDRGVTTDKQFTASANLRGDLGDNLTLSADPISIAVGVAYRNDRVDRVVSPLSDVITNCAGLRPTGCTAYNNIRGGYQTYNPGRLAGKIGVKEAYAELGIPILRSSAIAESLDLTLAGRVTDYSTSGVVYTWKVGPNWQITKSLRLRATRSQDIRAPYASDLFADVSSSQNTTAVFYPTTVGGVNGTTTQLVTGNPNLDPEIAQTLTAGAVYQPSWLRGFQASVDYYSVKIGKAISSPAAQTVVDRCYAGDQAFCSFVTVGGNPVTTTANITATTPGVVVRLAPVNISEVETSGLDVELGYVAPAFGGRLNLRALGSYVFTYSNSELIAPVGPKLIGAYGLNGIFLTTGGGIPRWTGTLTQQYERPISQNASFIFGLTERLIAPGKINPNYTDAQFPREQNRVPQITYLDANLAFDLKTERRSIRLFLNVLNVLDKDPPVTPVASTFQAPTNFQIFDVLGRRFTAGVKVTL